jgi:hypothetical protein
MAAIGRLGGEARSQKASRNQPGGESAGR